MAWVGHGVLLIGLVTDGTSFAVAWVGHGVLLIGLVKAHRSQQGLSKVSAAFGAFQWDRLIMLRPETLICC
ncbi:hypothetical protein A9Q02_21390 [Candidatus Chloroploca asiatica]|uniref:Uncharacterized protein n=1 Tax=Candidatus Chloroploca asiatica TaxID=1506545 RepID=A0A2H3KR55_9CHLR|nr:hypothetical protein A9Q02_21390 [Candidatus Chloroploca asiatica]